MKRLFCLAGLATLISFGCSHNDEKYNLGIGVYPGNPDENTSPVMVQEDSYRNIALNRAAYASSSFDYNLTAQLVTDGIVSSEMPRFLQVSTPEGSVPRREREWLVDQGPYTRPTFEGASTEIVFELGNGWKEMADNVQMLGYVNFLEEEADGSYEIAFYGSEDGTDWDKLGDFSGKDFPGEKLSPRKHSDPDKSAALGDRLLPRRLIDLNVNLDSHKAYSFFKVSLNMPGAQEWLFTNCDFYNKGQFVDLVSSQFFCSTWMSLGTEEEWVYVDLGAVAKFDKIVLHWLNRPAGGRIQTSNDAADWKDITRLPKEALENGSETLCVKGKGRYVRVLMDGSADESPLMLSEMEIWGRGGLKAVAPKGPAPEDCAVPLSGGNWKLKRAAGLDAEGCSVSSFGFDDSDWLAATVPGTVLTSYVNIGAVPDPNHADNIFHISDSYFNSDFWYRKVFDIKKTDGKRMFLEFDGINWKAEVYFNGEFIGCIEGAFTRGRFDITDVASEGKNILAVKIIKNAHIGAVKEKNEENTGINGGILGADNPTFHASIGWDWISTIRGRNIGIWNDVRIVSEGAVSLKDPFVNVDLPLPDTTSAVLTPEVYVRNNDARAVCGVLKGFVGEVQFEQEVVLKADEEKVVRFDMLSYPQLLIENPLLWWPNGYGKQNLYDAGFEFIVNPSLPRGETPGQVGCEGQTSLAEATGKISDSIRFKVGIRQVNADEEDGILHLYVNGRRFIGRGGNWGFSENNLNYRGREYDIAVDYHADMNFTIMRNWVGQTGDVELYEACDRHGIMIWQDFWLANPADGPDPDDHEMFLANAEDYLRQHRSHPSLVIYCGRNEGFPPKEIDEGLRSIVGEYHPGLHYISSSADGCVSGHGPYRALSPKEYFTLTSGNDRFHSERGMPAVMTYESMLRTYSPDALWPQNSQWGQHDFTLSGAQAGESFNKLIADGYGEPQSAEEFARLGQFINYDGYRAMFESRSMNRKGLLLWMSHPAWPSMTWQTYDWYFEPTAAYFGCKKGSEPLHIQWNPADNNVEIVNYNAGSHFGLTAKALVMNMDGKVVWETSGRFDSMEDTTLKCFHVEFPDEAGATHFIKLYLTDTLGNAVSDNFYINGTEYGNHQTMAQMAKADVKVRSDFEKVSDGSEIHGDEWRGSVTLENRSKVPAVMIRLNVVGKQDGEQILPMFYGDNWFSLMPGEKKTVSLRWYDADSRGNSPKVIVTGYNL